MVGSEYSNVCKRFFLEPQKKAFMYNSNARDPDTFLGKLMRDTFKTGNTASPDLVDS